jgi:hypothetical protein
MPHSKDHRQRSRSREREHEHHHTEHDHKKELKEVRAHIGGHQNINTKHSQRN